MTMLNTYLKGNAVLLELLSRLSSRLIPMKLASTEQEHEAIRRQRYRVFGEELEQAREGYDHETRQLRVRWDDHPAAFSAYVGSSTAPSASLLGRAYRQDEVPAEDAATYALDRLPDLKGHTVSFLSHLVADPSARGSISVISLISGAIAHLARERKSGVVFIDCKPGLVQSYRKMGLRTYGAPTIPCVEGVLVPMMAIAGDVAWMRQLGSPLYPTLQRLQETGDVLPQPIVDQLVALTEADPGIEVDPASIAREMEHVVFQPSGYYRPQVPIRLRERLAESGFVMNLADGTELIRAGAADREMYIVMEGALQVSRDGVRINQCIPGELVGEVAFFWQRGERTTTLHAHGPTRVLVIRRRFVERLKTSDPALAAEFLQYAASVLADRYATAK